MRGARRHASPATHPACTQVLAAAAVRQPSSWSSAAAKRGVGCAVQWKLLVCVRCAGRRGAQCGTVQARLRLPACPPLRVVCDWGSEGRDARPLACVLRSWRALGDDVPRTATHHKRGLAVASPLLAHSCVPPARTHGCMHTTLPAPTCLLPAALEAGPPREGKAKAASLAPLRRPSERLIPWPRGLAGAGAGQQQLVAQRLHTVERHLGWAAAASSSTALGALPPIPPGWDLAPTHTAIRCNAGSRAPPPRQGR